MFSVILCRERKSGGGRGCHDKKNGGNGRDEYSQMEGIETRWQSAADKSRSGISGGEMNRYWIAGRNEKWKKRKD